MSAHSTEATTLTDEQRQYVEWRKCKRSPAYFIDTYCKIYDADSSAWIPFSLWPEQIDALDVVHANQLSIILKARQIGLTWLLLSYGLWQMLFKPIAVVLIFSRRDDEATYLLGDERLKGIYSALPDWMKAESIVTSSAHQFTLSNQSTAYAFPTTGGDSYTATLAIVDEADLIDDLKRLMSSVRPTIDAGGKLALISRVDKKKPNSYFKAIYRAARNKTNSYSAVFLPWHVRPGRTAAWYKQKCSDAMATEGSLDSVYEQYPANDIEALAPRSLDKRIPPAWMLNVFAEMTPLDKPRGSPSIGNELRIYRTPLHGHTYVIGGDPAEGNPTSDDSAAEVIDVSTGEQVASLAGKYQPSTLAAHIAALSRYYNDAHALIERNNHGHAVLMWLRDNSDVTLLEGWDGKQGWLSNSRGKSLMYDGLADIIREQGTIIHDFDTYTQIGSIEGSTLRAPDEDHDDKSDAFALAHQAASMTDRNKIEIDTAPDVLYNYRG